jgi:transposase
VFDYIQRATGPWIECPVGITAREKSQPPKTLVQEVTSNEAGVRVFVVHSDERLAFERAQRTKSQERVREKLQALERRVASGKLKAPEKIGAAAQAILARNHGHRYYGWSYEDGAFRYFEHPVHFAREQAYEGKYIIQTEETDLSPIEAVRVYKELSEVERAFASLKDVIEMRPIHHRTAERVQAHIFVASLALLIHRAIEKKLKSAGLDFSATEALAALKSLRVVDIALADSSTKRCVTQPTPRVAAILRALGISALKPATPPPGNETLL